MTIDDARFELLRVTLERCFAGQSHRLDAIDVESTDGRTATCYVYYQGDDWPALISLDLPPFDARDVAGQLVTWGN
jgi:hypothetical protein